MLSHGFTREHSKNNGIQEIKSSLPGPLDNTVKGNWNSGFSKSLQHQKDIETNREGQTNLELRLFKVIATSKTSSKRHRNK